MPEAACVGRGRLFDDSGPEMLLEQARLLCRCCGVRRECLDYAVSTGQSHGVWGGLTTQERQQRLHEPASC